MTDRVVGAWFADLLGRFGDDAWCEARPAAEGFQDAPQAACRCPGGRQHHLAARGGAWTPTLCASYPRRAQQDPAFAEAMRHRLATAVALNVTIMTGTDVVGTVAREVALLAGTDARYPGARCSRPVARVGCSAL
jgi:hypothetical protein